MKHGNDDLIELVLSSKCFSDNEKKHFSNLISSGKITEEEENEVIDRICKDLEEEKKKINKIDNEIIRNQEILDKYTKLENDTLDKVTDIYEKEAELNIKKVESFIDKTYSKDYEDYKKEEKELENLYKKFLEKADKNNIEKIKKTIE